MVGQPNDSDYGSTDWLNKATPDNLIAQGKALVAKIASMDRTTQDRFVQELGTNPANRQLFERIGQATS